MNIREKVIEKFLYVRNNGVICVKPRSVKDNGNIVKRDDYNLWKDLITETSFLDKECPFVQRIWHIYNEIYEQPICCLCKNNLTKFRDFIFGYNIYCCPSCAAKGSMHLNKLTKLERYGDENYSNRDQYIETNLKRYGVDNTYQREDIKEKIRKKNLKERGVEYPMQCEHVRNKSKNTYFKIYGVDHISQSGYFRLKYCSTCLNKYGVEYPLQNENIKTKTVETNLLRYEVKNPTQNAEISQKAGSFKNSRHKFTLPSGIIISLQGYEPFGLNKLLSLYDENEIKFKRVDMPEIWYVTNDGSWHRYFPDFYIPKDNLIIEIKSKYTYNIYKELNELKKDACLYLGYKFQFLIFKRTGEEEEV